MFIYKVKTSLVIVAILGMESCANELSNIFVKK